MDLGSQEQGTPPADEHSDLAPSRLDNGSGKIQCPQRHPVVPHRPQQPRVELCALTLETGTRTKTQDGICPWNALSSLQGNLSLTWSRWSPGESRHELASQPLALSWGPESSQYITSLPPQKRRRDRKKGGRATYRGQNSLFGSPVLFSSTYKQESCRAYGQEIPLDTSCTPSLELYTVGFWSRFPEHSYITLSH